MRKFAFQSLLTAGWIRRRSVTWTTSKCCSDTVYFSLPGLDRLSKAYGSDRGIGVADGSGDSNGTQQALREVFVPVRGGQMNFVVSEGKGDMKMPVLLSREEVEHILNHDDVEVARLGDYQGKRYFSIDVLDPAMFSDALRDAKGVSRLPVVAAELKEDMVGILAYARGIMWFHRNMRFCSVCGSPMKSLPDGNGRFCISCKSKVYPRIDPAIITLVTMKDRCLLGRKASWPTGRYSLLAGFVEVGETLEDALSREVKEESGVDVDLSTISYHSSQPWPFPRSLMIGFKVEARSENITVKKDELQDVKWFTKTYIKNRISENGVGDEEFNIPSKTAMANRIIHQWIQSS